MIRAAASLPTLDLIIDLEPRVGELLLACRSAAAECVTSMMQIRLYERGKSVAVNLVGYRRQHRVLGTPEAYELVIRAISEICGMGAWK